MPRRRLLAMGSLLGVALLLALPTLFFRESQAPAAMPSTSAPFPVHAPASASPPEKAGPTALTLSNARASVNAQQQRIEAELEVSVDLPGGELHGKVNITGGIRPDPATMRFFLSNPDVTRLELGGLPTGVNVDAPLKQALARYFRENPVYSASGPVASATLRVPLSG